MLSIAQAANVNVYGYPAWNDSKRPWIGILAKGDDQLYYGNKNDLELLKECMTLVYTFEEPLLYRSGVPVQVKNYNYTYGQLAKKVVDRWDFISTYAETSENRIT